MKNSYFSLFTILCLFAIISCSTESTPVYQLTTSSEPEEAGNVSPSTGEYNEGDLAEITATANNHWIFDRWAGGHTGDTNPATITINSDKDIKALFVKREYPLIVNTEGEGTVAERVLQSKTADYPHGTSVELTANPSDGWVFTEWGENLEGNDNPATITLIDSTSISSEFKSIDELLTLLVEGEGTVDINQESAVENPSRNQIELTADATEGWEFVEWIGDISNTKNPEVILIDGEKTVTAVFEAISYTIDSIVEGEGEIVISPLKDNYSYGEEISVSVIPNDGWNFVHWSGDLEGSENPKTITIKSDISIIANLDNSPFAGGDGSDMYPYQISSLYQLQQIRNYSSSHFIQVNNIDATETINWNNGIGFIPIGNAFLPFGGSYQANGFSISNLFINRPDENEVGLFGSASKKAKISNIDLRNVNISGSYRVGGVTGRNSGKITQAQVSGILNSKGAIGGVSGYNLEGGLIQISESTASITSNGSTAGGLIGFNGGIISDSFTNSNVTMLGGNFAGGLVGSNMGKILNSESQGVVTGDVNVGGLVGENRLGEIRDSYSGSAVQGLTNVGGLVGENKAIIINSYSIGNVQGYDIVGGLVGSNYLGKISKSYSKSNTEGSIIIGGLVGLNKRNDGGFSYKLSSVTDSYATGTVQGDEKIGGLVGVNAIGSEINFSYSTGLVRGQNDVGGFVGIASGEFLANYWDIESSDQNSGIGLGSSDEIKGLISPQLTGTLAQENMPEFDWTDIWITTDSYPKLQWQQ